MPNVNVDRNKLAEYIKKNAQAIANGANIDMDIVKIETMAGAVAFEQSVEMCVRGIPLEEVEAK